MFECCFCIMRCSEDAKKTMNKALTTLESLKFLKAGLESADVPLTLLENLKLFQRDKKIT